MVLANIFRDFFLYIVLSLVFFLGYFYSVQVESFVDIQSGCTNHFLLCAPMFYNNFLEGFNFLSTSYGAIWFRFFILFIVFITFWIRIQTFKERMNTYKVLGLLLLLLSSPVQGLFKSPDAALLSSLLFIFVSIGFEVINHGRLIRGILLSASILPLLFFNGEVGVLLTIVSSAFFYFMVKWQILKKYTLASYSLLLFPVVATYFGGLYLNAIYDGNISESLLSPNIKQETYSSLFQWLVFMPLFFIYYFKDKKGLNQIKRFIIPIFMLVNLAAIFLRLSIIQEHLFAMCLICFSFEIVSDVKFKKRSLLLVSLTTILIWLSRYQTELLALDFN